MRLSSTLMVLALTIVGARANFLVNELSFGHDIRLSPDGSQKIPNFELVGKPNSPEVLSNKVILTPPAPGNQRGGLWATHPLQQTSWIADVDFRTTGPERGGGNMNIWLVKDGASVVQVESIYTVSKFEGLGLVIDQYGGSGGMIRGFLNDGTKEYNKQHNVDSLAFGHCIFAYRNLGRPLQIKLRHTETAFKVEIDGRLCFETDKVRIPEGYQFGLTAASADNPDSFEVFKMVVLTEQPQAGGGATDQKPAQSFANEAQKVQQHTGSAKSGGGKSSDELFDDEEISDESAERITSSNDRFADLHNRIQIIHHLIAHVLRELSKQQSAEKVRYEQISSMESDLKSILRRFDRLDEFQHKMDHLEKEMRSTRNDLGRQIRESENSVKNLVSGKHEILHEKVERHSNVHHTRLILFVVGLQAVLIGLYIVYSRRKTMPKKYL